MGVKDAGARSQIIGWAFHTFNPNSRLTTTTNYQPPTTNYQPPTTNHQPAQLTTLLAI